jgi:hypothetical protein
MSKTAKDFAVESIIQSKANKKRKGTVLGNNLKDGDLVLAIEWDNGALEKVNVDDVEVSLTVEQEFELLQNDVNSKLNEAAKLIREASNLAESKGLNLRSIDDDRPNCTYDYLFAQEVLEDAMDGAGWNTSSWNC